MAGTPRRIVPPPVLAAALAAHRAWAAGDDRIDIDPRGVIRLPDEVDLSALGLVPGVVYRVGEDGSLSPRV